MRLLLFFRWTVCQHCAFPQRDQSVQSGRAPSSQVETLQQRGDPSIPEQSMCTVFSSFLFFNFAISPSCVWAYSDSLKTKHVISHALRLRLVLFDESNRKLRKRLSSLPPLLSLIFFFSWSERKQQGKLSDKIQKLEQQTELLGHWGWVFVRRVKCFAL